MGADKSVWTVGDDKKLCTKRISHGFRSRDDLMHVSLHSKSQFLGSWPTGRKTRLAVYGQPWPPCDCLHCLAPCRGGLLKTKLLLNPAQFKFNMQIQPCQAHRMPVQAPQI